MKIGYWILRFDLWLLQDLRVKWSLIADPVTVTMFGEIMEKPTDLTLGISGPNKEGLRWQLGEGAANIPNF